MFSFTQNPGKTTILFKDEPILAFVTENVMFRSFMTCDARFRPGGPIELINLLSSAFYGPNLIRCQTDCATRGADEIAVTLTPQVVDHGLLDYVREARTIRIGYDRARDRFVYTITVNARFLRDVRGGEGVHITPMKQWGKDDYAIIEFDDPLLAGGVGPQVPMTQDWEGIYEPWLASDCFKLSWRKRFLSVRMHTAERGLQKITFNRIVNGVQQFYNRHVLKTVPRTPYFYEKTEGGFLKFAPLFDYPAGHHICEWGYDMHFYALLEKAGRDRVFAAGQEVTLRYQLEVVETSEVPLEYLNAPPAAIEPDERAKADRPVYEEPRCRFTESCLDHPDSYGWVGTQNCRWNRAGGRQTGHGALEIDNGNAPADSLWQFEHFGPSSCCNPIPALSRFKVSGWVRADEPEKLGVTLTVNSYQGPALYSPITPSRHTATAQHIVRREGPWAYFEFTTGPVGSYNITGNIGFAYSGKGKAALTELGVERL